MERPTGEDYRAPEVIIAEAIAGLELVQRQLDEVETLVLRRGEAEPGAANSLEQLSEQGEVVAALGSSVASRALEVAEEVRPLERKPFDEERAFEGVVRFLADRIGEPFTTAMLKEYFDTQGIVYPSRVTEFNKFFKAWQEDARHELMTKDQHLVWAPMPIRKGKPREFVLATVVRRSGSAPVTDAIATLEQQLIPKAAATDRVETTAPTASGLEEVVTDDHGEKTEDPNVLSESAKLALGLYNLDPHLKANILYAKLVEALDKVGITADDVLAAGVFKELADKGILHKHRVGGSLYFDGEPQERTGAANQEKASRSRELDEQQKQVAKDIMSVTAANASPQARSAFTPRQLLTMVSALGKDAIDDKVIGLVCRQLARQKIFLQEQGSARRGGLLRYGFVNKEAIAAYRRDPAAFAALVDSAETYSPEQ